MKLNKGHRGYNLIGFLGITMLAIFMLVSIVNAAPYAYITNSGNNTVSVIDIATNTVTATIPVGGEPGGVAVSPDGTKVYVANLVGNTVSVIDTATNKVTATVPVGNQSSDSTFSGNPFGIAVTPDGTKVYVANENGNFHTVSVIDTAVNTVIATVPIGNQASSIIGNPYGVAIATDGNYVYVTDDDKSVYVIDTSTNTITTKVPVLSYSQGVAVSPDGKQVYITSIVNNTVSVIDSATNTVTATVPVGNNPTGIVVNPKGTSVYVSNVIDNTISVIDTATNKVTATVPVGKLPVGIAVTPDGTKVYVANGVDNTISVIDTGTNKVTATIYGFNRPTAFGLYRSCSNKSNSYNYLE